MVENKLIKLHQFDEKDFTKLISTVPDARFLLQWAGPKYIYPLDVAQLNDTLAKTTGEQPSFKVFKATGSDDSEAIGHIQLMNIGYSNSTCILGRVLIFPEHRGKGSGKEMVRRVVEYAFTNLGLHEITLDVFDFNASAISTYKSVGFVEYEFNKGARQFQDECWNIIKMKLNKDQWLFKVKC